MMVNNITKNDKELEDIINNFFDGTLNNKKERRIKKTLIEVTNNQNTFPPKSVSYTPSIRHATLF